MKNLLSYHFKVYLKSNKLLLPFLIYLIYLFSAYSIMPYAIVSSFSESAGVIFFIMTFVGFSYAELENPVTEQLLLLKVHNDTLYYLSRIVVLVIVAVIMSVVGIVYPLIGNIYNHFHLFTRSLTLADLASGFVLHCAMGVLGALNGSLFHPRIIRNRKIAILLVFFAAVLAIAKGAVLKEVPVMGIMTWIFPPVYDVLVTLTGSDYFSLPALAIPLLWALIYGTLLIIVQIYFLKKNKF